MSKNHAPLVVIGGGPAGYPAAFRAADLGMDVTLIDKDTNPGGVCLYRGCIPSKALLHLAKLINETREAAKMGVAFAEPSIDVDKVRAWKDSVVKRLTGGLGQLTKARKIHYIQGTAAFIDNKALSVEGDDGKKQTLTFDHAIIATGSRPTEVPGLSVDSPLVMNSTEALALPDVPGSLLIVGGGYIGLEMGTFYAALGAKVSVVEMLPAILPGADTDLARPLAQRLGNVFEEILVNTRVASLKALKKNVKVTLEGPDVKDAERTFDKVLISVGRRPNTEGIGLENTKVVVNDRGFVEVDPQRRTAEPHLFAVGDVAGEPMLAHKGTHEGLVAVEAIQGKKTAFAPACIPAVVFTDPELAWVGLTESEAKEQGRAVKMARFPWAASGRATTLERGEGLTKLIIDPETERVLGVGICGVNAGDMIAEGALAIEMGAVAEDLALTIHPHPTLSESVMEAAEVYYGHCTHMAGKK
jgi:dihydrolipoamide dehydrogenase